MFAIVEFTEEENVAVVPSSWILNSREVLWPPGPKDPVKLAATNSVPGPKWAKYPARVLKSYGTNFFSLIN